MSKGLIALVILASGVSAAAFLTIIQFRQQPTFFNPVLDAKLVTPDGVALYGERAKECKDADSQIILSVSAKGELDINQGGVIKADLPGRLRAIFSQRKCKLLYIDPHPSTPWSEVVYIVDAGKGAGALSLMMTEGLRRELGYPAR